MQIASKRFGIEAAPTVYQFKRWMNCNEAELHSKHSFPMHALTRKIMHSSAPSDWWADYGSSMKELQQLAELVLSVCPHACGCERTWSMFGGILTSGRASLLMGRVGLLAGLRAVQLPHGLIAVQGASNRRLGLLRGLAGRAAPAPGGRAAGRD